MATTQTDAIAEANDRVLEIVTAVQTSILDATKSYVSTLSGSGAPNVSWPLPAGVDVPQPKVLIEETFRFQARLLEANKGFALSIADAWAQPAPKATAARAAAK